MKDGEVRKGGGRAIQQHDEEVHRLDAIESALLQRQRLYQKKRERVAIKYTKGETVNEFETQWIGTKEIKANENAYNNRQSLRQLLLEVPIIESSEIYNDVKGNINDTMYACSSIIASLVPDLGDYYKSTESTDNNAEVSISETSCGTVISNGFDASPSTSTVEHTDKGSSSHGSFGSSISSFSSSSTPCENSSSSSEGEGDDDKAVDAASRCSNKSSSSGRSFSSDEMLGTRSQITARLNPASRSSLKLWKKMPSFDTFAPDPSPIVKAASVPVPAPISNAEISRMKNSNGVMYLDALLSHPSLSTPLIILSTDGEKLIYKNAAFVREFSNSQNSVVTSLIQGWNKKDKEQKGDQSSDTPVPFDQIVNELTNFSRNISLSVACRQDNGSNTNIEAKDYHIRAAYIVSNEQQHEAVVKHNLSQSSVTSMPKSRMDSSVFVALEFEAILDLDAEDESRREFIPMYTVG